MLKHIISFFVFVFFLVATVLGLSWYNGYDELRQKGSDITYWEHVRDRVHAIRGGDVRPPGALGQLKQVGDEVNAQRIELLGASLDQYAHDTGEYPLLLGNIIGSYVADYKDLINDDTFTYRRTRTGGHIGFEMSIILPSSGEVYTVSR